MSNFKSESHRKAWIEALMENLERALAEKRFAFALQFCEQLLAVDPHHVKAWLIRGHLAWKFQKDHAKAVECYRKVIILGGYESSNAFVAQARTCLAQLLELAP